MRGTIARERDIYTDIFDDYISMACTVPLSTKIIVQGLDVGQRDVE
jgi:hypothetical protein